MKQQVYEEALKRIRAEARARIDAMDVVAQTANPESIDGAIAALEQGKHAFRLLDEIVVLVDRAVGK